MIEKSGKRVKAHIRYTNAMGKRLPGVTTVIGILNKPLLVPWANRLGLEGVNVKDYVSDKADIGTLVHEMMFCDLRGTDVDFSYYTGQQIDIAKNSFKKYLVWKKEHTIEPIMLEEGMVSEKYQYGGTIDFYGKIDNVFTLIDYKTCKALYSGHFVQVSAYRQPLRENGYKVKQTAILRVGRSELEGFEYKVIPNKRVALGWKKFKHCLAIYNINKLERKM